MAKVAGKSENKLNIVVKKEDDYVAISHTETEDIKNIIQGIDKEYNKSQNTSSIWRMNLVKWFRQRYGIRPKTNFPWRNASNQHLPLVDKTIRKMKPEYTSSLWNSKPMCTLSPVDEDVYELAQESSWHLDWLLRSRMNIYPTLIRLSDIMLGKGFAIAKVVYAKKYEPKTVVFNKAQERKKLLKNLIDPKLADIFDNPERLPALVQFIAQSYAFDMQDPIDAKKVASIVKEIYTDNENVEFTVDAITYDAPEIIPLDPETVFVPSDTITEFDLENAPWIIHRYPVSVDDLVSNAICGKWDKEVVKDILTNHGITNNKEFNEFLVNTEAINDDITSVRKSYKDQREGQSNPTSAETIMIHEVCMWYDSDGDGKPERHILEYCTKYTLKPLRFIKYPYNMAMWPYVKIPFELTDGTHYSPRGIAEILHPLACALNEQHNMRINRQYLATTPWMFYNSDQINYKNLELSSPDKPTGVKGDPRTAITWTQAPNSDQSFQYEEQFIHKWAEDISASTDMIQQNSSQTLGEAKMNAGARVGVRQQDIDLWNMALREVFKRVLALWNQYGPQTVDTYTDETGKVAKMMKSSFMKNWQFNVNGRLGLSDPILQAQEALADLDRFNQDPMIDQYFLRKDYLEKKDPLKSKFMLKTREVFAQEQAQKGEQMKAQADTAYRQQVALALIGKALPLPVQEVEAQAMDIATPDPTPEQIMATTPQMKPGDMQKVTRE